MTDEHAGSPAVAEDSGLPGARNRQVATLAMWVSGVALLVGVVLVVLYRAADSLVYLPIFMLGVAAGVTSFVLAVRARRERDGADVQRGQAGAWAVILASVAFIADLALIGIIVAGVVSLSSVNAVLLSAQGPPGITVTYSDDVESYIDAEWPDSGWARFNTEQSSTEITVKAPEGEEAATVSCQITWNDEEVVRETSDSGTVTCSYAAR